MIRLLLGGVVGLLPWIAHGAPHTQFKPLVMLDDDRRVAICGSAIETTNAAGARLEVRLFAKRDTTGPLTVMTVEHAPADTTHDLPIKSATLRLRSTGAPARLEPVSHRGSPTFRALAHHTGTEQGSLVRSVLLSGGYLEVVLEDDAQHRFEIIGPAPADVFRNYLACAGDLYRPVRN